VALLKQMLDSIGLGGRRAGVEPGYPPVPFIKSFIVSIW
jgi:hypothetical protein